MATSGKNGRTANVKRNIFYGLLQIIVSQMLPFIVRTILIYRFGADYLGLNSLFTSILSVLSLMEFGFGTAIVYSLYKPVSEGDDDLVCAFLSYYRSIYKTIGLAVLAAGLSLIPFLDNVIKDPKLPGELNLYSCYLIFLGDAVISYLLYGYKTAIPTAYQRRDILSKVEMGMSLLKCVLQSLFLISFTNFYIYLLTKPFVTIVRNITIAMIVKRKYPNLESRGSIDPEHKRDLNRRVYGIFMNKLTTVSRNSMDSMCISAFVGLAAAGIYTNYYFVMSSILTCSVMACRSLMASVGNSIVMESREKNYTDMRRFDFIFMAIAGWATVCLLCLYQPFIKSWVGPDMMLSTPVIIGICMYFYILVWGQIRWVYHEGAGLWYEGRFIMIGEAIANIVLNIMLCRFMGVLGIVLATVLSVFVSNCILSPELIFRSYFKNGKLKEYWLDHLSYAGTMILTAIVSWYLCERFLPLNMADRSNWVRCSICLGGRLLLCTLLSCLFFLAIWRRTQIYKDANCWIKKMIKE